MSFANLIDDSYKPWMKIYPAEINGVKPNFSLNLYGYSNANYQGPLTNNEIMSFLFPGTKITGAVTSVQFWGYQTGLGTKTMALVNNDVDTTYATSDYSGPDYVRNMTLSTAFPADPALIKVVVTNDGNGNQYFGGLIINF